MGYCYTHDNKLVCDSCSAAGGVRKMKCPFGYCPAPALCKDCRTKHKDKLSKAYHRERGCEQNHNAYQAEVNEEAANHKAGIFILSCAIGLFDGSGMVRVTFFNGTVYRDFLMHEDVYDKRDTAKGRPTLNFFQSLGTVTPIEDGANLITKRVS